jgi:hypothetical protein
MKKHALLAVVFVMNCPGTLPDVATTFIRVWR